MSYERLSTILDRQRRYRVLDLLAAAVLAIGIASTVVLAIGQAPGLSPLYAPQVAEVQPESQTPAQFTAAVLAEAEAHPQATKVRAR